MRQATVFVVDDEEQICSLLTRILQRDGLRVVPFRDAAEAVVAAASDAPDLVITDMMMPALSGLELAERIKAIHPRASVIVITGYASLENVVDAMRSGVDDFVTKPFGVAEIRAVVQRVLARRAGSPAAEPATAEPPTAEAPATEASPPPSPETPAVAAETPRADDAREVLARRLRDVALLEALHGLLGADAASADLADESGPALQAALGAARCALVVPEGDGRFRVASVSGGSPTGDDAPVADSSALAAVLASGVASAIDSADLGALADRLGHGPAAAAPLRPRDPGGEDAGLLVVARPADDRTFDADDLRVVASAASALGAVFHAVRATERAERAYVDSLLDVVAATERRAPWFRDHSARVRDLSVRLARRIGLSGTEVEVLDTASRLLDIGRVHVQDDVLAKSGRLSTDEWRLLRSHPEAADSLVRPLGRLRDAKPVIRHHHENWDGSGYPDGLRGDDIPFLAALVRITDTYAALTAPRPWRAAMDRAEAVRRLVESSGTQFHPQLVAAFAEMEMAEGEAPAW